MTLGASGESEAPNQEPIMLYRSTKTEAVQAPRDLLFDRTPQEPTGQGRDILPGEVIEVTRGGHQSWLEEVLPLPPAPASPEPEPKPRTRRRKAAEPSQ